MTRFDAAGGTLVLVVVTAAACGAFHLLFLIRPADPAGEQGNALCAPRLDGVFIYLVHTYLPKMLYLIFIFIRALRRFSCPPSAKNRLLYFLFRLTKRPPAVIIGTQRSFEQ